VDYVLTEHVQDALKKRQIHIAWMEQALTAPEVAEADPADADLERRFAGFGHRVLRVVVNTRKRPPHVVRMFFDRRRTIP
jgi:hypothetical protein